MIQNSLDYVDQGKTGGNGICFLFEYFPQTKESMEHNDWNWKTYDFKWENCLYNAMGKPQSQRLVSVR